MSISPVDWFLARTNCQHCCLHPGEQVVTNQPSFFGKFVQALRLYPQARLVAVGRIGIPMSPKTTLCAVVYPTCFAEFLPDTGFKDIRGSHLLFLKQLYRHKGNIRLSVAKTNKQNNPCCNKA